MFDKDITVINKCYNKMSKKTFYKVSYIKGFWSSSEGININGVHLIKDNETKVMILMSEKGYQEPNDFINEGNKLTIEQVNALPVKELNSIPVKMLTKGEMGWTLQKGDYLVKGKIEDFETISKLVENNQNVIKITKIQTKDYGSKDMWHWSVIGE